ncbi:MAG: hypothetical protein CMN30_24590 [Sandaracinus sp.]|nr:hypothetical protein [Sandaracinus sp.]
MKRVLALSGFAAVAAALVLVFAGQVRGDEAYQHVVREGETLASIAERYYGDPRRENVLVAENGLTAGGGAPIEVGLRLLVPHVTYHRVEEGQTWSAIARRFYGDPRRSFVIVEANDASQSEQPAEGTELLIPYPLRHVTGQSDTLQRVAKAYYGNGGRDETRRLRRFNDLRTNRIARGQIILVPVEDLKLSDEGRAAIEEFTGRAPAAGEMRARQAEIDEELPGLLEHVRRGRFTEAVQLGNRLLGAQVLTGNQIVTIQRELGTAYVALGRVDLAVDAFREALQRQPDLQLDTVRTSPPVMRAFQRAKEGDGRASRMQAQPEDAGAAEDDAEE